MDERQGGGIGKKFLAFCFWTAVLGGALSASGAAHVKREAALVRLSPGEIPALRIDDEAQGSANAGSRELFRTALLRQLPECSRLPRSFELAGVRVARERWCEGTLRWFLKELDSGASLQAVFERARTTLEWYRSTGKPDTREVQFVLHNNYFHNLLGLLSMRALWIQVHYPYLIMREAY